MVLTRIRHDGSSRNRGVAKRDGQAQPRGTEAYLKQYGEGLSGEHARHTKLRLTRRVRSPRGGEVFGHRLCVSRSGESEIAIAVEVFMNNAG
jgi:hypothetical protein